RPSCRPRAPRPSSSASLSFSFHSSADLRDLHSFPTRRSSDLLSVVVDHLDRLQVGVHPEPAGEPGGAAGGQHVVRPGDVVTERRSEEHTSELQSRFDLVCRLLLEKKKEANDMRNRGGLSVTSS